MQNLKKLKATLDKIYDFGKLPRGITLCDCYILADIYNALVRRERLEFIQQSIHDLLVKCGLNVEQRGIGWVVSV